MVSSNVLEVNGDHIKKLSDADLRRLILRLCEAELRRCGLPTSAVTAGGHQDAPDGGIDVRVRLVDGGSPCLDFIPRPQTGFQSKACSMPPADIAKEMRPKNKLRSSIGELGAVHGAYVIVSSEDSTTDAALDLRIRAMNDALSDLPAGSTVKVDFYDRERIANWVRVYAGVALWLREQIGEPISGWRAYGTWAPGDRPESEFLLDKKARIYLRDQEQPLTVAEGISAIRRSLSSVGGVVRLVGLSGVGKTRLVQALFDNRIGSHALDTSIVLYTDQGAEPDPSARDMVHRLRAAGRRSVVVVDNCNPATHRALAEVLKQSGAPVSLITVEYDVTDDEPEDTDVFHLEPGSEAVVEQIIERLVPNVEAPDRSRIAEFSGGNARVALVLAKTLPRKHSLGVLDDSELFKRLFYQNQQPDPVLMRVAEVCSLVYSFDGESESADAELSILAGLANLTFKDVYRGVGELRARDLVQARGKWRAVLPHAIANRLAKQTLERIPPTSLVDSLKGHERLLRSFARRLGFLHDSANAIEIAQAWLEEGGSLSDARYLSELDVALLLSIAPLCPDSVLGVLERAATRNDSDEFLTSDIVRQQRWVWLLRALAYEPTSFDRAALILARLCAANASKRDHFNGRSSFEELFHIVLSGTRATIEQRIKFIRNLSEHTAGEFHELALVALESLLQTGHFTSSHDFSFGARSRDFGWHPTTNDDVANWYRGALALAAEFCQKGSHFRLKTRAMLARHFRGLWMHAGIQDELVSLAKRFAKNEGWSAGWIAVRMTITHQSPI